MTRMMTLPMNGMFDLRSGLVDTYQRDCNRRGRQTLILAAPNGWPKYERVRSLTKRLEAEDWLVQAHRDTRNMITLRVWRVASVERMSGGRNYGYRYWDVKLENVFGRRFAARRCARFMTLLEQLECREAVRHVINGLFEEQMTALESHTYFRNALSYLYGQMVVVEAA